MDTPEQKRFREYLTENNLKLTSERRLVLDQVFAIHGHFEAEDVVMGLRDQSLRVSRASVYRTLPLLVDSSMLRVVYSADKHSHFEHVFGHEHHDHMVCVKCGQTIEFCDPRIEALQSAICEKTGFRSSTHKLEITGTCSSCARAE